jgi:hypothetical protein
VRNRIAVTIAALVGLVLVGSLAASAAPVQPPVISWQMVGSDVVRFHLAFHNSDPAPTQPISGEVFSQEFGAFLPHYGQIGPFVVPMMAPDSFFDVFLEVPLSVLPPSPTPIPGSKQAQDVPPCPASNWVGNVEVIWEGPGGAGQVSKHNGTLGLCPGGPASLIRVTTGCAGPITWNFAVQCPGWVVALLNEDRSVAPTPLPPGWTGFVCVSALPSVPVGSTCCFTVNLTCPGMVPGETTAIDMCAEACQCPIPTIEKTWGQMKSLYR